jgi:putative spermidine/putrescine transport system permease protein
MRNLRGVVPLAAIFSLFYLAPFFILVLASLSPGNSIGGLSVEKYTTLFADRFSLRVLADTLLLGLEVTVVALVLALPLAMFFRLSSGRKRAILTIIILLPMLTSTVVRTFAWIVILGRDGLINSVLIKVKLIVTPLDLLYSRGGLIVALAQIFLPLMVLPVINSMNRIDDRLLQASEGLGATRWRTFFQVLIPLSGPGILAGTLLTYAGAVTAFITQTLVGGGRQIFMPLLIYQQSIGLQKWSFAAAMAIVFTIVVVIIMAVVDHVGRRYMRGVDG